MSAVATQLRDVDLPHGKFRENQCVAALNLIQQGLQYLIYSHNLGDLSQVEDLYLTKKDVIRATDPCMTMIA